MTNGEAYQKLTTDEKIKFRKMYNEHPLFGFIDWKAFYNSEDGNAMNFVNCQNIIHNKYGQTVYVLEDAVSETGEDYKLVYVCEEDAFYKISANACDEGEI